MRQSFSLKKTNTIDYSKKKISNILKKISFLGYDKEIITLYKILLFSVDRTPEEISLVEKITREMSFFENMNSKKLYHHFKIHQKLCEIMQLKFIKKKSPMQSNL